MNVYQMVRNAKGEKEGRGRRCGVGHVSQEAQESLPELELPDIFHFRKNQVNQDSRPVAPWGERNPAERT